LGGLSLRHLTRAADIGVGARRRKFQAFLAEFPELLDRALKPTDECSLAVA
jgi:hypothetical protein